jgi:hypothetical protein
MVLPPNTRVGAVTGVGRCLKRYVAREIFGYLCAAPHHTTAT